MLRDAQAELVPKCLVVNTLASKELLKRLLIVDWQYLDIKGIWVKCSVHKHGFRNEDRHHFKYKFIYLLCILV